jgi:hypothetical protein
VTEIVSDARTGELCRCVRVAAPQDVPPPAERTIDIALLDMNHGYPNVGHDAIVDTVRRVAETLRGELARAGAAVRVVSYAVRDRLMIPPHPGERFLLYLGSGGPGHIDPRCNRRECEETGEIVESAAWEEALFALFDAIAEHEQAALLGVCHTFGVLCRWAGIARPVLRGREKGGKSSGVRDYTLTAQALRHPWFKGLAAALPDGRHLPVIDSRYYDLIPTVQPFPPGMAAIAFETNPDGSAGEALTMCEFARAPDGRTPRIFAVNDHPEIGESAHLRELLDRKLARSEITQDWYDTRAALLSMLAQNGHSEPARLLGRRYTFSDLVRAHLARLVRSLARA